MEKLKPQSALEKLLIILMGGTYCRFLGYTPNGVFGFFETLLLSLLSSLVLIIGLILVNHGGPGLMWAYKKFATPYQIDEEIVDKILRTLCTPGKNRSRF